MSRFLLQVQHRSESVRRFALFVIPFFLTGGLTAQSIVPENWDPALAGDQVMERLVTVTADRVKGAHDAEMVIVEGHAYIVSELNDVRSGESAGWPEIYASMSIVDLETLETEKIIDFARSEQVFENVTLPVGACYVPRIIQKDENTLRCYFSSEQPGKRQSKIWYRDYSIDSRTFASTIHPVKIKTAAGVFDMEPRYFHEDAVAQGFTKPGTDSSLFLFDSFKEFDGRIYVAINNFGGKQNGLAVMHDDFATFEVVGHYNEPQTEALSESAVNRLPDGTWMAICRNDKGNYHFTTSSDGKSWSVGREMPFVPNGANSKPTFDKFGDYYYLGWQEATKIHGVSRSVFNVDVSKDGVSWERKYRFESTQSFQYPTFREHDGNIWVTVTRGDHSQSRKERIAFGKLEAVGEFTSQEGLSRKPIPTPPVEVATMKEGVKLFTDRKYGLSGAPEFLKGRPFLRTTIDNYHASIAAGGVLFALTPPESIEGAASQEEKLRELGFTRTGDPVFELFPGAINHVCVFRKEVAAGEAFDFKKVVLLVAGEGVKFTSSGEEGSDPVRGLDGAEAALVDEGGEVWSDRDYQFTKWPDAFAKHRHFVRSSIGKARFEVQKPGYVVVLTPEKPEFNQENKLTFWQGFEKVDLPSFHPYETKPGKKGNLCHAFQKKVVTGDIVEFGNYGIALWSEVELPSVEGDDALPLFSVPTLDISGEQDRHSFVARGTPEIYQGHVDTVLMPDGKTMWATWALNHAGYLGPLAKSKDGGKTWSDLIPTHPSWADQKMTTPTIHRLVDPGGKERLFVFAGQNFPGRLRQSISEDVGKTWSPMLETGLKAECPPKSIMSFDGGKRLVMWCDRRDPDSTAGVDKDPVVWQSESLDGGLTWSPEKVVVKVASRWSQPAVIESEDGETLVMLLRNHNQGRGQFSVSRDAGETWTEADWLPLSLTGHRPNVKRAPDGRLVVVMRDTARDFEEGKRRNPTAGQFVAWVGTFEDILKGRDGQYRVKLLHNYAGSDTGYSGLEVLPDGTFVATTYVKYKQGLEKHSVVATRFRLQELDSRLP